MLQGIRRLKHGAGRPDLFLEPLPLEKEMDTIVMSQSATVPSMCMS